MDIWPLIEFNDVKDLRNQPQLIETKVRFSLFPFQAKWLFPYIEFNFSEHNY